MKELTKSETGKMEFNGREIDICTKIYVEPEMEAPDFDYGSKEANDAEMRRFDSGELVNVIITVDIWADTFRGTDSLGQCFLRSEKLTSDVMGLISDHGMIEQAKEYLRQDIEMHKRLLDNIYYSK